MREKKILKETPGTVRKSHCSSTCCQKTYLIQQMEKMSDDEEEKKTRRAISCWVHIKEKPS
jgi:hypothetical protein